MLSEIQKLLIQLLAALQVSEKTAIMITLLLDETDMICDLSDWIERNPKATEQEIFSKSLEIKDGYQGMVAMN